MNALLAERLKAVERSARVRRYHTEPVIHQQNVGEHTYGVMWFILLMVDSPSANLLKAALMHDTAEYAVGDVPSHTKKTPVIKQAFDQLEDEMLERLLWKLPDITDVEARFLKVRRRVERLDRAGMIIRKAPMAQWTRCEMVCGRWGSLHLLGSVVSHGCVLLGGNYSIAILKSNPVKPI